MALKYKVAAVLAALAVACACTPRPHTLATEDHVFRFVDAPFRAGLDTVAILTPTEPETMELWQALVAELAGDFNTATVTVEKSTDSRQLALQLDRLRPACVVVVDNRTLALYRELQRARPHAVFAPAIVVMSSYLGRAIGGLRATTGIAYEVPVVSSVTTMRDVSDYKIDTVGVVHRRSFESFVQAQARLLAVERVRLVPAQVGDDPADWEVEEALDHLIEDERVDALWVLDDNRLLTPELIANSWLPVIQFQPIPVFVGVPALVHPVVHFGTLAVLPDHTKLGVQVANMVFDLADNDWRLPVDRRIELPLSVRTVVDVVQMEQHFALKDDALTKIDQVVR